MRQLAKYKAPEMPLTKRFGFIGLAVSLALAAPFLLLRLAYNPASIYENFLTLDAIFTALLVAGVLLMLATLSSFTLGADSANGSGRIRSYKLLRRISFVYLLIPISGGVLNFLLHLIGFGDSSESASAFSHFVQNLIDISSFVANFGMIFLTLPALLMALLASLIFYRERHLAKLEVKTRK